MKLPPLPPEIEHRPDMLKWRLDHHDLRLERLEQQEAPSLVKQLPAPLVVGLLALGVAKDPSLVLKLVGL